MCNLSDGNSLTNQIAGLVYKLFRHNLFQMNKSNTESVPQVVVTPIGAVLTAKTGDTTRSPGHRGFFLSVTGSLRFFEASRDPLEGGVIA